MPALGSDSFELNGIAFAGSHLSPVEFGRTAEFDYKNNGSCVEHYIVRFDDAREFRRAALGGVSLVGGELVRENGHRHGTFLDLNARQVSFSDYLPQQPGDDDGDTWCIARVEYSITKDNPADETDAGVGSADDENEQRASWSEQWDVSAEAVMTELAVSTTFTERKLVYLPQARLTVRNSNLAGCQPDTYMTNYAGKINSVALKLPSRRTIAIRCALYMGCSATATRLRSDLGFAYIAWDLSHQFMVRPYSWNQVKDRTGTAVALSWPDGNAATYEEVDLQPLIDNVSLVGL